MKLPFHRQQSEKEHRMSRLLDVAIHFSSLFYSVIKMNKIIYDAKINKYVTIYIIKPTPPRTSHLQSPGNTEVYLRV